MELKEFFHMNGGDGELSYSQNSSAQKQVLLMNQELLDSIIQSLLSEERGLEEAKVLNIVDLGCGVGPTPLAFVALVKKNVEKKCKDLKCDTNEAHHQLPKVQIFMNDLPSNDFNMLFRDLLKLESSNPNNVDDDDDDDDDDDGVPSCFLMSAPGSYYHRLFPSNTLHFVHANYTLHWFSQTPVVLSGEEGRVPINKGNVYISETSSKDVSKTYFAQFEQDFTKFLKFRSQEVVSNGLMLLTLRGRPSLSDSFTWQPWEVKIFTKALISLKSEGLIKEEKLDCFNFPYYCASKEELESIVKKEGSFAVETKKTMAHLVGHEIKDIEKRSIFLANFVRAFSESLIIRHFGEDIVDPLYDKVAYYAFQFFDHGHLAQLHSPTILIRKL